MIPEAPMDIFSVLGTSCFSWSSRKQQTTAQSTAEAEYIAVASYESSYLAKEDDEGLRP